MPGVLAGLIGALMAGIATEDQYQQSLYQIFPARASPDAKPTDEYPFLKPGSGWSAGQQALNQIFAILATLVISFFSGILTGKLTFIITV